MIDVLATCRAKPNLFIPELHVQFVDGEATVTPETAKALKAYALHGVEVETEAKAVVEDPPARRRPAAAKSAAKPAVKPFGG